MKLAEEVVVPYLGGGWGDHHHQGRLVSLLSKGASECGFMFLQGFPEVHCIPPLLGVELGIRGIGLCSEVIQIGLPVGMDIGHDMISWLSQPEELLIMDLSHSGGG